MQSKFAIFSFRFLFDLFLVANEGMSGPKVGLCFYPHFVTNLPFLEWKQTKGRAWTITSNNRIEEQLLFFFHGSVIDGMLNVFYVVCLRYFGGEGV